MLHNTFKRQVNIYGGRCFPFVSLQCQNGPFCGGEPGNYGSDSPPFVVGSLGMWAPDSLGMRAPGLLTGARQFTDGDMLHNIGN